MNNSVSISVTKKCILAISTTLKSCLRRRVFHRYMSMHDFSRAVAGFDVHDDLQAPWLGPEGQGQGRRLENERACFAH